MTFYFLFQQLTAAPFLFFSWQSISLVIHRFVWLFFSTFLVTYLLASTQATKLANRIDCRATK